MDASFTDCAANWILYLIKATRIDQEIAENKGGTVWSDRKDRLEQCISQKNGNLRRQIA